MTVEVPKIDIRDQEILTEQIQKLALIYCSHEKIPGAWKNIPSIQSDKRADTLIHIFARMMEIVISRLNKVPDKNFLTFLDMVGVRLLPPRVACAPLTFTLANGATQYGLIPAGTQVATAGTEGQEAVVFETEKALTVILPELVKAVSLCPADDRWSDHSQILFDNIDGETELFKGKELIPHCLYIGHSKLFNFKEETIITLETSISSETDNSTDSPGPDKWDVNWYYYDEKSVPKPLEIKTAIPSGSPNPDVIDWKVANLLKSGSITFKPVAGISEKKLTGIRKDQNLVISWNNNWIFAELSTPLPKGNLPKIGRLEVSVANNPKPPVVPDLAFFNNIPLDLSKDFYPFGERPKFNDTFYVASNEVFSKKNANISMSVTFSTGVDAPPVSDERKLILEAWNGSFWEQFSVDTKDGKYDFTGEKGAENIVSFVCPNIEEKEINGEKNRWIRVRIIEGNYGEEARYEEAPTLKGTGKIRYNKEISISGIGTRFTKEIRIGDSIVLISNVPENQTRTVTSVVSDNSLSIDSPFNDSKETEFFIKKLGWTYVPATYKPPSISKLTLQYGFSSQDIPESILTYNDFVYESYQYYYLFDWDRITGNDNSWILNFKMENFDASWVENAKTRKTENGSKISDGRNSLYLSLTKGQSNIEKVTLTSNNAEEYEFAALKAGSDNRRIYSINPFTPFTSFLPEEDEKSAFYLAFEDNIATLPVTLFFPLIEMTTGVKKASIPLVGKGTISSSNTILTGEGTNFTNLMVGDSIITYGQERKITSISKDTSLTVDAPFSPDLLIETKFSYRSSQDEAQDNPFLTWEYWTGNKWLKLKVEDNTINLTKREMIQFIAPPDIVKKSCFGFESEYYWIRARLYKGRYASYPKLKSLYTNTVWARNQFTVQSEILGNSNGNPDQIFKFSHFPILPEQKVLVMELSLTEEDKRNLIKEEGSEAVEDIRDDSGNIIGYWVCWHEVTYFYFSEPNSRHYIIDRIKGTITFGDGKSGMIPPVGKNNIKCSYKAGGGASGNVKAKTITKLRTTFPYIDRVSNPEGAEGGSDKEEMDRVIDRGPQTLKHRDRAVTYEDFVWLAKEASSKVARAKCLPTTDIFLQSRAGWITLIIVPESEDPKPVPNQQLIAEIESYISERTSTFLTSYSSHPSQINITGPGYLKVSVEASVQFTSISEAKTIEARVIDTLNQFFHPIYGGPEKKGWNFGRNVYISEVYAAIENLEGVDHVEALKLNSPIQIYEFGLNPMTFLYSYPKKSIVKSTDGSIMFSLAKSLLKNTDIKTINVTGFKEGDSIILQNKESRVNLIVRSVSHDASLQFDILECEPAWIENEFPEMSTIETLNKNIKSYIMNEIKAGSDISLTPIKVAILRKGLNFVLINADNPLVNVSLEIKDVNSDMNTIFMDDNYLVYSGIHSINKK